VPAQPDQDAVRQAVAGGPAQPSIQPLSGSVGRGDSRGRLGTQLLGRHDVRRGLQFVPQLAAHPVQLGHRGVGQQRLEHRGVEHPARPGPLPRRADPAVPQPVRRPVPDPDLVGREHPAGPQQPQLGLPAGRHPAEHCGVEGPPGAVVEVAAPAHGVVAVAVQGHDVRHKSLDLGGLGGAVDPDVDVLPGQPAAALPRRPAAFGRGVPLEDALRPEGQHRAALAGDHPRPGQRRGQPGHHPVAGRQLGEPQPPRPGKPAEHAEDAVGERAGRRLIPDREAAVVARAVSGQHDGADRPAAGDGEAAEAGRTGRGGHHDRDRLRVRVAVQPAGQPGCPRAERGARAGQQRVRGVQHPDHRVPAGHHLDRRSGRRPAVPPFRLGHHLYYSK